MTSYQPPELDSCIPDSVSSSPRSDYLSHDSQVRFMCSFGGNILPRPHDNQLRYVGGDTRMVAVHRSTTFSSLLSKLSKLSAMGNITVKYQLPNEELDSLISVTTDEDVENMIEEFGRLAKNQNPRTARLRLFLFPKGEDLSRASSTISSILDGSANRENWFIDALNSRGLERGLSEASSMLSEVPDSLFGLDNSDETQPPRAEFKVPKSKLAHHDNISILDPGAPAPAIASPYGSTSSALTPPCVPPHLPPVKTKPDSPVKEKDALRYTESGGEPQQPIQMSGTWMQYQNPDSAYSGYPAQPVYYVPGPVQPGRVPIQPVPAQGRYFQTHPVVSGQVSAGYNQLVSGAGEVYGGEVRSGEPVNSYNASVRAVQPVGSNHQVYHGAGNSVQVAPYPVMLLPGGPQDQQRVGPEQNMGRLSK